MKFTNQVFTDDVTLDYNEFIDCEIKNCVVMYYGGKFSLIRTKLTNVRFGLGGAAGDTLMFLRLIRANRPNLLDRLLKEDGSRPSEQSVSIN